MRLRGIILVAVFSAAWASANDFRQQYEKAYYLETAKGQEKQAAAIYKEISGAEITDENRNAVKQSLIRLLGIANRKKHEPTIQDCHEKLLSKTDLTIQGLVDLSEEGSTIYIPAGIHEGTVLIEKDLILKGSGTNAVLSVASDKPLIHITRKTEVIFESLTLKSERETSERTDPPGCALYVKDAGVTVKNCSVIAPGDHKRCPLGIYIQGFSDVRLIDSTFHGYEYPMLYGEGTEGVVKGCFIKNPGHSGFMSHLDSEVTLEENIFTGSAYHGIRSTGGTIHVKNNLIVANKNRGIYLGNKTTHGEIINNAVLRNGSGISAFASADVEIENNVILKNGYSGIDTRCYGKIQVKNNIIAENEKTGFAVFEDGSHKFKVGKNTFCRNGEPSTDYDLPSSTITEDPEFTDPENGDFSVKGSTVKSAEHGLTNPEIITALWTKYKGGSQ